MIGDLTQRHISGKHDATNPVIPLPEVSRRSFIKLLGLAMVGVAGAFADESALPQIAGSVALPGIPTEAALLARQAFEELRVQGYPFDMGQASVVSTPKHPELVGVLLRDTRVPPHASGANISLTIDLKAPRQSALYYLVGESTDNALLLTSTRLSVDGGRNVRAARFARADVELERGKPIKLMRQLPYQTEQLLDPDDAGICTGWREQSQWYYDHGASAAWLPTSTPGAAPLHVRYTSTVEHRNCRMCPEVRGGAPQRHHGHGAQRQPRQHGAWYSETHRVDLGGAL